jgi:hypothetical protein
MLHAWAQGLLERDGHRPCSGQVKAGCWAPPEASPRHVAWARVPRRVEGVAIIMPT